MKERTKIVDAGPNANDPEKLKHPAVQAGIAMMTGFAEPALQHIIGVIRAVYPELSDGTLILHTKDGRRIAGIISTVMEAEEPDVDAALRVLARAQAMIETQKVKS